MKKPMSLSGKKLSFMAVILIMAMTWTSYASRGIVKDRRITLEQAKEMAAKASQNSQIELPMNDDVLSQINKFVGTQQGRSYFKSSLERKAAFEKDLQAAVQKYDTPDELNAIPIIESGYRNVASYSSAKSAGLWMFIPATARTFGMAVQKGKDERFDTQKETMAAHKYLLSNKKVFNDWLLGIFAFNVGERAVMKGIQTHGTRDVWELSKFVKGDKDYMSRVVAAMIIMKNPEVLQ